MRGGAGYFLAALVLASAAQSGRTRPPRAPGTTLAESDFRDGNHDGWTARGGRAELCKDGAPGRLAAMGHGKEWFFVAPPQFLGDKVSSCLSDEDMCISLSLSFALSLSLARSLALALSHSRSRPLSLSLSCVLAFSLHLALS
jgi:hypothetical protein